MKPVILASASPRRRELMTLAGYTYQVQASDVDEVITKTNPADIVQELSWQKACSVALKQQSNCIVIGCDTLVADGWEVMGKPRDTEDAIRTLTRLSGHTHQVHSGVTIIETANGQIIRSCTFSEVTHVHVMPMSPEEIAAYVMCGECMDKAGSYAIQGKFAVYIKGIDGDYYNVVGLPIARLHQEMKSFLSEN